MLELETRDTGMHYRWRVSWQRQCDALALVSFSRIVYPATKQKWYKEHFEDSVHLASNWYIGPPGNEGTFVFLTAFSLLGSWGRYAWLKAGGWTWMIQGLLVGLVPCSRVTWQCFFLCWALNEEPSASMPSTPTDWAATHILLATKRT